MALLPSGTELRRVVVALNPDVDVFACVKRVVLRVDLDRPQPHRGAPPGAQIACRRDHREHDAPAVAQMFVCGQLADILAAGFEFDKATRVAVFD